MEVRNWDSRFEKPESEEKASEFLIREKEAAGGVLTAKQAPHRPGTAPALGLRAGCDVSPFDRRPTGEK
jgi:hypothetical protein